jgi:hypothetical protein
MLSDRKDHAAERAAMDAEEDDEQEPDKKLEELYKSSRPTVELLPGVNLSAIINSTWLPRDAKVRHKGARARSREASLVCLAKHMAPPIVEAASHGMCSCVCMLMAVSVVSRM